MSNKVQKAYQELGQDTITELEAMSAEDLKNKVVEADRAMRDVTAELEANPAYEAAKLAVKDLSAGKRDVFKRQRAIIAVALELLNKE